MIPGEYLFDGDDLELNAGRATRTLEVNNTGDRPVQVGSHYHFFEVNRALVFNRAEGYGMRLDLPAGTAVRFEPGEIKTVRLIAMSGLRQVYGGNGLVMGALDDGANHKASLARLVRWEEGELPFAATRKKTTRTKPAKKKSKRS